MVIRYRRVVFISFLVALIIFLVWPGIQFSATQKNRPTLSTPYSDLDNWPSLKRPALDPVTEHQIDVLLDAMSLAEKVGQMTQGEISSTTPEDVTTYALGAILNGGGSWPGNYPEAGTKAWLSLADQYWLASQQTSLGIPVLWGTDAVHGHNNVRGATLFPHNIGLGATNNPDLIQSIAQATAEQVMATGLDWTFAPTVAVAQNPRWGRFYESFGQQPGAMYQYAHAAVLGYQGRDLKKGILATAKHFIADGATTNGRDQGNSRVTERALMNLHAQGYYGALEAGAQIVMASFSSWKGLAMHAHAYLLTDVLKTKMGFDGFVISDWDALSKVEGCRYQQTCAKAINAGIDMVMVPHQWKGFIDATVAAVERGEIPMSRIDDAVRRILRVKIRAGLFEKPMPSQRHLAGNNRLLNSLQLNQLARQAVRESLVLLKNNHQLLPLKPSGNYLIAGDYDALARQNGGWSLTWQGGAHHTKTYFPEATTILDGVLEAVIAGGGHVTELKHADRLEESVDAIIAVISEPSYAETMGDYPSWVGLTPGNSPKTFFGIEVLNAIKQKYSGVPIVTVYQGGRPLWLNPQLNQSDAFVVGWLPGTQGAGVADGLFGIWPIKGTLPVNWPRGDCSGAPANRSNALFPMGYGLTFDDDVYIKNTLPSRSSLTLGDKGLAFQCIWQNQVLHRMR